MIISWWIEPLAAFAVICMALGVAAICAALLKCPKITNKEVDL